MNISKSMSLGLRCTNMAHHICVIVLASLTSKWDHNLRLDLALLLLVVVAPLSTHLRCRTVDES